MDMDLLINSMIKNDIEKITNKIDKCYLKSTYNKLSSDLSMLYDLADILKFYDIIDKCYYIVKYDLFKDKMLEKQQKDFYNKNYEFNSELTDNYIYILKKYTEKNFRYNVTKLDYKDSQDLVAEFLLNFDKNIYNSFKKCVENYRFIYLDSIGFDPAIENLNSEGITFYGKNFKPYVLIQDFNSIFTSLVSVHEIGHIYDFDNLKRNKNNYLAEIYSHFLELVFGDYLKENRIDLKNVKYNYLDNLEEIITDLSNLLEEDIITNLDFKQKYNQIYYIIEYAYGMILALEFYDIYLKDKELGKYTINEFSKNKNNFKNPMDLIEKFDFDKEKILEGETLKKFIKRI